MAITWGDQIELFVAGRRCGSWHAAAGGVGRQPRQVRPAVRLGRRSLRQHGDCLGRAAGVRRRALSGQRRESAQYALHRRSADAAVGPSRRHRSVPTARMRRPGLRSARATPASWAEYPASAAAWSKAALAPAMQIAEGDPLTPETMVRRYGFNASLFWCWAED